ncbi:hypothetical protein BDK63_002143 [Halomonas campaniensis]|uniref:EF-hand domain-containing protein n=1 Tax=Halomonas campaniensis TaxID=213554 RepID=A0A7W5K3F6_9GAMM|nr:EF-hand domain-containing protein [Halomonas campaniensis]MBB3331260.1 hypothetical protein [Halomonas campaniensis]
MKNQKAALFIALSLVSGIALAERGSADFNQPITPASASTGQNSFEALDRNGDGVISPEEAEAGTLPANFLYLDRNHDGVISLKEFNYRPR